MAARKKVTRSVSPKKSGAIAATAKMLNETRSELKSDITTLRLETRSGFKKVDARFSEVDARFDKVDAQFSKVDARFNKIDARFSEVDGRFNNVDAQFKKVDAHFAELAAAISDLAAKVHRTNVLVEEQNARNIYVLDGYTSLDHRLRIIEGND